MFHKDLTRREGNSGDVYYIGWLDPSHSFDTGEVPPGFLKKLVNLRDHLHACQARGYQDCLFCSYHEIRPHRTGLPYYSFSEVEELIFLGSAEIWVPDATFSVVYAAPDLILHYIADHHYLPPWQFIEAVLAFDRLSSWSMVGPDGCTIGHQS